MSERTIGRKIEDAERALARQRANLDAARAAGKPTEIHEAQVEFWSRRLDGYLQEVGG